METRKGRRTADEERKLMDLLTKSYDYLNRSFMSFDQKTKVHIALELIKRRIPQEMNVKGELRLELADRISIARQEIFQN